MNADEKAIIACATGAQTPVAIAVIRLSGFERLTDLSSFFSIDLPSLKPRQMRRANLLRQSAVVDDICLCFFKAPHSYTGENLLELYVHGNSLNVQAILDLFLKTDFIRHARPGEFSQRALQNKKLSLPQVEGLDLFLNATTPLALQQGMELLNGDLHTAYLDLYNHFLEHRAALELLLDFSEDIGEDQARLRLKESWKRFYAQVSSLKQRLDPLSSRLLRPEIVLAGAPNAGKSTLFNSFLGEERAIVSAEAGTTRDFLAEDVVIEGVNYRLIDTAGIRETSGEVEKRGIVFSQKKLDSAFFSILLINPFQPLNQWKDLAQMAVDLIVFTHADLPHFAEKKAEILASGLVLQGQEVKDIDTKNSGLGVVSSLVNKKYLEKTQGQPILIERHRSVISDTYTESDHYNKTIIIEPDVAILSHQLTRIGNCLEELLGIVSPDNVLDHIFANFCIGK